MTYKLAVILALLAQAPLVVQDGPTTVCTMPDKGGKFTCSNDPKPLPSPKPAATPFTVGVPDTEVEYLRQTGKGRTPQLPKGKFPFIAVDNGTVQLTIADGDMPVGPCDIGKLVRAARRLANLDRVASPSFRPAG